MFIKKLAITDTNYVYHISDLKRSLSMNEGGVSLEILEKHNFDGIIKTTTGQSLFFCNATFKDNMDKMKKRAAIIIPKDVGFIITETGLTKDSVILEAGSGSGGLTCQLAALCKKIYSYDNNEAHIKVVQENCDRMDLRNVVCELKDIKEVDVPEQVDLVVLDLPNCVAGIETAYKSIKPGGYVVFYTPQITQAQDVVTALGSEWRHLRTIELIQRDWEIDEKRLRPKHTMLGHTAFLTITRCFKRPK